MLGKPSLPVRLGVNIDHVATLRQARGEFDPDPLFAAHLARLAGADQIVLHVREDRRHANESDLRRLRETSSLPINLEMALSSDMELMAFSYRPERVTLVPEKRQERTTEGGLVLDEAFLDRLRPFVARCRGEGIRVSLFMDPDPDMIARAEGTGVDQVEIHTGPYARAFGGVGEGAALEDLVRASEAIHRMGLQVAAGHGLTLHNLPAVLSLPALSEVNIGHSIVARAVLLGMPEAVGEIRRLLLPSWQGERS
ncbi:MAG: pyridoxine 5'-phosphate synthase [Leptospirillia bacterium]